MTASPTGRHAAPPDDDEVSGSAPLAVLLETLATTADGLDGREARHRGLVHGPNTLPVRRGRPWWRDLARQVTHPLTLLLWLAAALAVAGGNRVLAVAVVYRAWDRRRTVAPAPLVPSRPG